MKKYALVFAVGLLSLFSVEEGSGQKLAADPRPMRGLKQDTTIRTYRSVEEFLRRNPGSNLSAFAMPNGHAERQTAPVHFSAPQGKTSGNASSSGLRIQVRRAANGTISWMTGQLGRAESFTSSASLKGLSRQMQASAAASGVAQNYRATLGLHDPATELRTLSVNTDEIGATHVRMAQNYKGIPVWGSEIYIHTDARGDVYAINGAYQPTPAAVSITPALSGKDAIARAIADLRSRGAWAPVPAAAAGALKMSAPASELVLYPQGGKSLLLAYEVTLHSSLLESYSYLIDAASGRVIDRFARHCSILGHDHDHSGTRPVQVTGFESAPAAAGLRGASPATFGNASATDLNGASRTMRTYQHTNGEYYAIWDLESFNAGASQMPDNLSGGAITVSADQNEISDGVALHHVTSHDNQWNDPSAVSAHSNMKVAYDYYRNTFGRNAIDGNGKALLSVIHVTSGGQPMDNAFWNGELMAYGDGNTLCKPLAGAMDVAGHEMTHGIIQHTANLIYQGQSGALNESFADVFGVMMDREDYLLGEDVMLEGNGVAIRDLANPDNPGLISPQPAHMNDFRNLSNDEDNGGVHINSGITNRACYLIIDAIGREKTERIYYRALTSYLTRNSQFIDCRRAVIQAAKDLYGEGAEMNAAAAAFTAVGITDGQPGQDPNDVPAREGASLATFIDDDGRIGLVDMDRRNTAFFFNTENGATARVTQTPAGTNRTLLSTPLDGRHIYFINADGRLAFVDNFDAGVSVFTNLRILQDGDLWNASVSPDENYVAFTSAYSDDPAIYIYNGEEIGRIELLPESTQEGVKDETVKYADVISWSPNMTIPRLGFDAYRELRLGDNTSVSFWSMYEIDLKSENIYNLIPGQSADVSLGNMSYSKTDPDVVAFNTIAADGSYDVVVADYEAGRLYELNMADYSYNGTPITDAQRPSFSPDGSQILVSSPEHNALLVIDGEEGLYASFQLGNNRPMYNPHWFTLTLPSSAGEHASPEGTAVTGVAPNPFRTSTRISFTLQAAADVTVDVLNTRGEKVSTLMEGRLEAGEHSVTFESRDLATGVYTVRVRTGSTVTSERVVLVR